jgi:hypothetical protein
VHLSSFRVTNYKSFRDSETVRLETGFNVVVGANNVGKTALAEALSLEYSDKPHRSLETVPVPSASPQPVSQVEFAFDLSREDLLGVLDGIPQPFAVPIPQNEATGNGLQDWARRFLNAIREEIRIEYVRRSDGLSSASLTAYEMHLEPNTNVPALLFALDTSDKEIRLWSTSPAETHSGSIFALQAAQLLTSRIYYFKAERLNVGEAPVGYSQALASNASNLAQCLHTLQGDNPIRFQRLNKLIGEIFPEVRQITAPLMPDGSVRVLVWSIDPVGERPDLAVPLSEGGTGIGQVLAILYVVLTAEQSKTIVIDEPQSFLHPGAVRKLMELLKHYERTQHQYVITTHSPAVITAADPDALLLVRKEGEQSVVEEIDAATVRQQGHLLREVGATLSEVFGADNVIWVEGATEEECFPIIIRKLLDRRLLGTRVVGVAHTSDFERKHAKTAPNIYTGLSEVKGILPPTVGFIFDREKRTEREREELEERSAGKATLTSRRTYENYLLNPRAIAHEWEAKYFDAQEEESARIDHLWLTEVDGAKVLEDLFATLSDTRVTYDKVAHGVELTRWLCENAPEDLKELACLLEERLPKRRLPPREANGA